MSDSMSNRKLPVVATVRLAYTAARAQVATLGQIAARWGIAAGLALVFGALLVQGAPPDRFPPGERAAAMTSLAAFILGLGAYVIIVRWHRILVQDLTVEQTRRGALGGGILYLARAMFLTAVGFSITVAGSLLPITLTRKLIDGDARWYLAAGLTALAIATALALVARLCLILPAGAVGDFTVTLRKAWALTQGNTMRMLAGSALASGPAIALNFVANATARASETAVSNTNAIAILSIASLVLAIVAGVIQAGFLSHAYIFFVGGSHALAHAQSEAQ